MFIIPQGEEELQNVINTNDNLVLYFTATWCNPCKQFAPIVSETAAKFNHIIFLNIDIDHFFNIACKYNVRGVPTIVIIKNNENISSRTGILTTGTLTQLLSSIF